MSLSEYAVMFVLVGQARAIVRSRSTSTRA